MPLFIQTYKGRWWDRLSHLGLGINEQNITKGMSQKNMNNEQKVLKWRWYQNQKAKPIWDSLEMSFYLVQYHLLKATHGVWHIQNACSFWLKPKRNDWDYREAYNKGYNWWYMNLTLSSDMFDLEVPIFKKKTKNLFWFPLCITFTQ